MKKLLSIVLIIILVVSFAACELNESQEYQAGIKVYNHINGDEAVLKIDEDKIPSCNGDMFFFKTDLSTDEIKDILIENNPEIKFVDLNDREFLAKNNENCPYILFSKKVYYINASASKDICAVTSESAEFPKINLQKPFEDINLWYPYHLTEHYFSFEQNGETSLLSITGENPFERRVKLESRPSLLNEIGKFYEDCYGSGCVVRKGDLTGTVFFVMPSTDIEFRILVMKTYDSYAMKYWAYDENIATKLARSLIDQYINALNTKDSESYLDCFDKIDKSSVDVFLNNVKSCTLNSAEIFWADEADEQYIFKVDYTLISEDERMMGSLDEGQHDLVEYFTVGRNSENLKILNHYQMLSDCVRELKSYKEFANNEKDNTDALSDWLNNLN